MGTDDLSVLLQVINEVVDEAGLRQLDLAELLGVDQGRVSNLLRGARGAKLTAEQMLLIELAATSEPGEIARRVAARTQEYAVAAESGEEVAVPSRPPGRTTRRGGLARPEPDQHA